MAAKMTAAAVAPLSLLGPPQRICVTLAISTLTFSKSSLLSSLSLQCRTVALSNTAAASSSSFSSCFSSVKCLKRGASSNRRSTSRSRDIIECKATDERTPPTAETNLLVRMAWYGSEAFGKVVAGFRPSKPTDSPSADAEEEKLQDGPVERKVAVELLRADLDRSYFVTGKMATGIYEEDCEFADPFVSFKGLKRFQQNVGNLGSFMEESSLKLVDWQEYEDRIFAKWRFNCVLALPWRPILAASGSTEYFFTNDSGKIYKHIETWDISPVDGLRQLFKPNPKRKAEKK